MKNIYILILFVAATLTARSQNTFPGSGNVGIGTLSPAYNLDITSAASTTMQIGTSSTSGLSDLIFKGSTNQWKISKSPSISSQPSVTGILAFTCNTNVYGGDRPVMSLFLNGGYAPQVLIYGQSGSSFLGGDCLLGVDGRISSRDLSVSSANPFPDYVFKQGYKLMSLKDLESYIDKNSKLPSMPSAEEVKKDGLDLGKTTTLLVEKIEELTLHMIDLNKKLEKLEAENLEMENQIKKN